MTVLYCKRLAAGVFTMVLCGCLGASRNLSATTARPDLPPAPSPTRELSPTPALSEPTSTATPVVLEASPAGVPFALPLTIQHVTPTSATLFFELDAPSRGGLVYWKSDSPEAQQVIPLNEATHRHQITIDDLLPGTRYRVVVGLLDSEVGTYRPVNFMAQIWGEVEFETRSEEPPIRVGVIGDGGFGEEVTFTLAREMAGYDLDMVFYTGDIVYSIGANANPYEAFALKYYAPLSPLLHAMPVYPVVGNHDIEAATLWNGVPFYYHAFPPFVDPQFEPSALAGLNQWYALAFGDIQFLMLDTQTFYGEPGRTEQDTWLAERLADERFAVSIPVFHVAPYTSGRHTFDGVPVRETWRPLFEAAGVPLVLSGHDHNYERLVVNGITYVVSGGGSGRLYPLTGQLPESVVFARRTHFVLLVIYPDRIELQAIAVGGEILDGATIPLP